jgi:ABC-type phosphate transport system substrate-binding protein
MPRITVVLLMLMLAMAVTLSCVPSAGITQPAGLEAQGSPTADECLAILVNRSNPVENLSFAELRKVFLGEQNHWSDGHRITVVMLESGKPERQVVLTLIYRMDDRDFNAYFLHHVFTGDVHAAPTTLATPTEVLKFVSNVQGAIGYLRTTAADESVKVVRVDSVLPCDKDYSIRMHPKSAK